MVRWTNRHKDVCTLGNLHGNLRRSSLSQVEALKPLLQGWKLVSRPSSLLPGLTASISKPWENKGLWVWESFYLCLGAVFTVFGAFEGGFEVSLSSPGSETIPSCWRL